MRKRVAGFFTLGLIVLAGYLLLARPYQLAWGSTQEEQARRLPGDEFDPAPSFLATRAITVRSTAQDIWPWLVQMGYDRAGFYGYDILENVGSSTGMRSADRIVPELQEVRPGDPVPISSVARSVFRALEPNQYLIWSGGPGTHTFTWALYPVDDATTRLVSRIRWSHQWTQPDQLAFDLFTEFTDHLAVRKILQGVRDRAEGRVEPVEIGNVEFGIFAVSALAFLATLLLLLLRPFTWSMWYAGLDAGTTWLIVWYSPLPLLAGAALEALVLVAIVHALGEAPNGRRPIPQGKVIDRVLVPGEEEMPRRSRR